MWINYQFMAVCPLILNFLHISSQKWLVFANYFGLPNFLPQLANFFTRIYPSYPLHFPTLCTVRPEIVLIEFGKKCAIAQVVNSLDWKEQRDWVAAMGGRTEVSGGVLGRCADSQVVRSCALGMGRVCQCATASNLKSFFVPTFSLS